MGLIDFKLKFMKNNSEKTPRFVVISGPSGVGKGTVIKALLENDQNVALAVSATTRQPRENEIHGKAYYFLSDQEFDNSIQNDAFLEWCQVHQNRYGTLLSEIESITLNNKIPLLEIDVQGCEKIKKRFPNALTIFIAPPSLEELKNRLKFRNTDSESVIQKRLEVALHELEKKHLYDYLVINQDVLSTVSEIRSIIKKLRV